MLLPAFPARTQTFPERSITLIVPYPAGGPTDVAARALAEEARKKLGQSIVIENRTGGNGTTGAAAIARAQPDGYTLAILPATAYREPHINKVAFDPLTDISYIILLTDFVFGLTVRADAPWKTFSDFAADAAKRPGKLSIGAGGGPLGTPSLSIGEMAATAKVSINAVPFRGDADVVNALLGGHIDAAVLAGVAMPHIEAGKMRYIAAMTQQRIKRLPDVATLREQGVPVWIDSPYGIAGPKGMDPARIKVVHDAFKAVLDAPAGVTILDQLNQQVNYKGPDEYRRYAEAAFAREKERVAKLREAGRL
jgi:tripartite-type tricarboxylate transporter receptor subunit TctC